MKTKEILELIKANSSDDNLSGWDEIEWIPEEVYKNLEKVGSKISNPRRDYLGEIIYIKNKVDGKFFFMEIYGDGMYNKIYNWGEVKPVQKLVTVYEDIK